MIEVKEAALKAFVYVAEMETVARQDVTPEEFLEIQKRIVEQF